MDYWNQREIIRPMSYLHHPDEDFDFEERILDRQAIAARSCCDGLCGALDCVRCRGDEALRYIEEEREE